MIGRLNCRRKESGGWYWKLNQKQAPPQPKVGRFLDGLTTGHSPVQKSALGLRSFQSRRFLGSLGIHANIHILESQEGAASSRWPCRGLLGVFGHCHCEGKYTKLHQKTDYYTPKCFQLEPYYCPIYQALNRLTHNALICRNPMPLCCRMP